ncbi:MAG: hypothetical protein ACD_37C00583G0001, partial [uncultured bacterium]
IIICYDWMVLKNKYNTWRCLMPYAKAKSHVIPSNNLVAELAEIKVYGETRGKKSPRPFHPKKKQEWGLKHLEGCEECRVAVEELSKEIKEEILRGINFEQWLNGS